MDELKKKTETMLRAVLISSPRGVPLYRVEKEYRSITFEPIPYSKLGFKNLEGFLKSIPHVASIHKDRDGEVVVKGVASEADQHVAKLIAKQKKPKIKKSAARPRKPTFAFSATPNKYRGTNFGPRSHNFTPKPSSQNTKSNTGDGLRGQTPRFVPPRLRKILEANASQFAANQQTVIGTRRASSDDQKPKVTPFQISKRTVKSKGPNFQGMEVTVDNKITSPKTKSPPSPSATVTLSPEVLERIGKMVDGKANGLFLSRIIKDYKDKFGQELPGNFAEALQLHPEVVQVEKAIGNMYIAYPPKKTEQVNITTSEDKKEKNDITKKTKEEKEKKVELYIVKPFTVPNVRSSVQVYVSHVESAGNFFVQYKDCEVQIQNLQDKLNQDFKDTTDFITEPSPGMYCCAKFSLDDSWYRGKILKCKHKEDLISVEIFYVDFGNSEWLPNLRLRHLKKDHAELPQMALHCSLDGIDNDDSMTEILKGLTDKELKMTLVQRTGDVLCVLLADEEGVDVVAKFNNEKLLKQIGTEEKPSAAEDKAEKVTATEVLQPPSPPVVEQKKPVKPFLRSKSITSEQEKKIPERVVIPNDDYIDICVNNVFSTDNIIVMLYGEEYSDKLLALEVSLMSYFSESCEETPSTPKVGEIWALKTNELHSEDQWYRVKVLSTKDGHAQLEFVDYGDTRQAAVSDLKPLPARFLELPFQAVTLSLNDIPKTKKKDVIDTLKKFALGKPLVGEIIERTQDKISVELFDTSTETDININEIMRSLIIPDEDLTPALPKPGHQVTVAVSHISDTTGAVYVQIPGAGLTRLEELMTDITEHYNSKGTKAAEFVSQPTEGNICCAKCSDGSWYRAVILELLPDRKVKVQCVDYGNTEVVSRTALREPTRANEHVSLLPFQAVECCLGLDLNWDADKTEAVNQIMSDEVILEVTKQGAIPLVKLFLTRDDGHQVNVLDYILEDSQANRDNGSVDGSSPGKHEQTDKESSSQEDDQDDMSPDLPPPITLSRPWEDLTVSDIIDPGQFMFQPLSMLKSLENLTSEMTEYYKNKTETLMSPRMGDLCAVRDKDGQYYRAVVKAVLSPKQVCVLFIDYGNLDIHTSSDFRVLCDQFKQLPCIAVKGSLSGIQPSGNSAEWSEEAIKRLEELTQWKMLVGSIDGDQYTYSYREDHKIYLTLYDTSSDKDINIADVLVEGGLARRTDS